jgi:hypothetical protein
MAGRMILSTLVPRSYLRPAAAGFYKCRCLDSESAQYVAPTRMPSFPNCYPRKLRAHPKLRNAQAKAAQHDLRSAAPVGSRVSDSWCLFCLANEMTRPSSIIYSHAYEGLTTI